MSDDDDGLTADQHKAIVAARQALVGVLRQEYPAEGHALAAVAGAGLIADMMADLRTAPRLAELVNAQWASHGSPYRVTRSAGH